MCNWNNNRKKVQEEENIRDLKQIKKKLKETSKEQGDDDHWRQRHKCKSKSI